MRKNTYLGAILIGAVMCTTAPIATADPASTPGAEAKEEITTLSVQYQPISVEERKSLGMEDFVQEKMARDTALQLLEKNTTTHVPTPAAPAADADDTTRDSVARAKNAMNAIDQYIAEQNRIREHNRVVASTSGNTTVYAAEDNLPPRLREQFGSIVGSSGSSGVGFTIPDDVDGTAVKKLLEAAQTQLGVPYVWGGTTPNVGLDCSGFTQWAYSQIGVSLPRVTYQQVTQGKQVSLNDLKPGDLLFPADTSHVSMYIGNGNVIHAPQTGDVVKVTPVQYMSVAQARRIIE